MRPKVARSSSLPGSSSDGSASHSRTSSIQSKSPDATRSRHGSFGMMILIFAGQVGLKREREGGG